VAYKGVSIRMAVCDGPDCENEAQVNSDVDAVPDRWINVFGPSAVLGRFIFCSGACHDGWRVNVDIVQAEYEVAQEEKRQGRLARQETLRTVARNAGLT
jgi:hypothetical protein